MVPEASTRKEAAPSATSDRPDPLYASPTHRSAPHYLAGILGHSPDRADLACLISYEDGAQQTREQRPLSGVVLAFLHHSRNLLCRDMGVRVMSSNSYDGEYMGRIIAGSDSWR